MKISPAPMTLYALLANRHQSPATGRHRLACALIQLVAMIPAVGVAAAETATAMPGSGPIEAGSLLRIIIGLFVVLIAIAATAWGLRRWGNFRSSSHGELQIVGGLSMGPRERLVLVRVGDEHLLLGVAPGHIQTLHRLEKPLVVADPPVQGASFAENMRTVLRQRERT